MSLSDASTSAPLTPGVYMARQRTTGVTVYVGMAGERRGRGLRGRLNAYLTGKALVSGLGEAALDRALADPLWLQARIDEVANGSPQRAKYWGALAVEHADLQFRWRTTADPVTARLLEVDVVATHRPTLWNK